MRKLKNSKGFTLMEMLIVIAIIAVLIAIAIPTFMANLNKARVATDEANIRSGYASVMAEVLAGNSDVTPATTYFLQKDGSVASATSNNNYTTLGNSGGAKEIAGHSVDEWNKGATVTYTYTPGTDTTDTTSITINIINPSK